MPLLNDLTMFFLTNTIFSGFGDKDSLNVGNVILMFKLRKAKTSWTYCSPFRWCSSSPLYIFCYAFVFVVSESFLDLSPKCHKTLLWFIPLFIYTFSHHDLMSPCSHQKKKNTHTQKKMIACISSFMYTWGKSGIKNHISFGTSLMQKLISSLVIFVL
jgi:amino acid permease